MTTDPKIEIRALKRGAKLSKGARITVGCPSGRRVHFVLAGAEEWPEGFAKLFAEFAKRIDEKLLPRIMWYDPRVPRDAATACLEVLFEHEDECWNTYRAFGAREFEHLERLRSIQREWREKLATDPEFRDWYRRFGGLVPRLRLIDGEGVP